MFMYKTFDYMWYCWLKHRVGQENLHLTKIIVTGVKSVQIRYF